MTQTIPLQVHFELSDEQLSEIADKVVSRLSIHLNKDQKPDGYTIQELVEKYPPCAQSWRNWIKKGEVKARKIGRRIFIEADEVERALSDVKSLSYKR